MKDSYAEADMAGDVSMKNVRQEESAPTPAQAIERMLIKTGNLTVQVDDVKASREAIVKITEKLGGYHSEERMENFGDRLNVYLTIRVPSKNYDSLVTRVEGLAEKTDSKSVNIQDVTEEFIDVEARLQTKKELEARYREILKQARSVDEILSVESNLNNVRAEIESMEGRLKYLRSQVAYSTLSLNFYQPTSTDFGFFGRLGEGIKNGWTNLLAFIVGLVNIWPFVLLIAAGVWGFLRWRRRKANP